MKLLLFANFLFLLLYLFPLGRIIPPMECTGSFVSMNLIKRCEQMKVELREKEGMKGMKIVEDNDDLWKIWMDVQIGQIFSTFGKIRIKIFKNAKIYDILTFESSGIHSNPIYISDTTQTSTHTDTFLNSLYYLENITDTYTFTTINSHHFIDISLGSPPTHLQLSYKDPEPILFALPNFLYYLIPLLLCYLPLHTGFTAPWLFRYLSAPEAPRHSKVLVNMSIISLIQIYTIVFYSSVLAFLYQSFNGVLHRVRNLVNREYSGFWVDCMNIDLYFSFNFCRHLLITSLELLARIHLLGCRG
ncbi:unnamed protein product [Moneuplotes crassus]|uniref:Uncharacterized protein n=1 Tax=Euplotes crassus TaxID=5936 RepID=A0AAD1U884_EUPCR|nr:unnamed protein product [Moneuplotes crassus]